MKYALNLSSDGRILSATFAKYAPADAVLVYELPEGNISDYIYNPDALDLDGNLAESYYIFDPLPEPEPAPAEPTQLDLIEAQVTYTALMTDTLLEV